MAVSQLRSRRKPSGGRYHDARKKKVRELGSDPVAPRVGETKTKTVRVRGGHLKRVVLFANVANVLDPSTKRYGQAKIETVVENPANRNFVKRNILTRGAIIKTAKGNARVTSRPSQDGIVNAVLVKS